MVESAATLRRLPGGAPTASLPASSDTANVHVASNCACIIFNRSFFETQAIQERKSCITGSSGTKHGPAAQEQGVFKTRSMCCITLTRSSSDKVCGSRGGSGPLARRFPVFCFGGMARYASTWCKKSWPTTTSVVRGKCCLDSGMERSTAAWSGDNSVPAGLCACATSCAATSGSSPSSSSSSSSSNSSSSSEVSMAWERSSSDVAGGTTESSSSPSTKAPCCSRNNSASARNSAASLDSSKS